MAKGRAPCSPGRARQVEQPVAVDVSLEMVGEQVEGDIDFGLIGESGHPRADALQPVASLTIVRHQAMNVAARDPVVRTGRAVEATSAR